MLKKTSGHRKVTTRRRRETGALKSLDRPEIKPALWKEVFGRTVRAKRKERETAK